MLGIKKKKHIASFKLHEINKMMIHHLYLAYKIRIKNARNWEKHCATQI